MNRLADIIREEIKEQDILAPIKEVLIKSIAEQIKANGEAQIRWFWGEEKDASASDYCLSLKDRLHRELPLKMWLNSQGLCYSNVYTPRGELWGLKVTLPV